MLPLCLAALHQGPYTKVHTPRSIHQATFEGSNVHTPAYFYTEKKLQMSTFLVYLYKKNPLRASRGPYTSVHHYLLGPPHIMCHVLSFYHSMLITLSTFQRSVEDSNVHTPVYFYIVKNSKCPLFWYTYIRKNPFELSNIRTPEYLNTQILTSNSVLKFCATCAILLIIKLS